MNMGAAKEPAKWHRNPGSLSARYALVKYKILVKICNYWANVEPR